jgi:hypothetical protein
MTSVDTPERLADSVIKSTAAMIVMASRLVRTRLVDAEQHSVEPLAGRIDELRALAERHLTLL